jgi:8-oxo-dGTP pyrophosphatase MutT (NUDIX family)
MFEGKRRGLLFLIIPATDATLTLLPQFVEACTDLSLASLDQATVEHMIREEQDAIAACSPRAGARWRKNYPDNVILLALAANESAMVGDYIDYVLTGGANLVEQVKGIILAERSRRRVLNSRSAKRPRHSFDYTATAYVLSQDNTQVLMILKSDGRWFPPGGHVEEGEYPHEAVAREVYEETGYTVRFIQQPDGVGTELGEATLLPVPYQILLEDITTHHHHDFIYLCHIEGERQVDAEYEGQWIDLARVPELPAPSDIHFAAQQLLRLFEV